MVASKPCPFCAIAAGEADAHVVYEDETILAFLDKSPLMHGHVLLIPRAHVETFWDADDETVFALGIASKRLAIAVKAAMASDGVFVAQNNVVSQSVPHLHVHIIPRNQGDGFFSPRIIWKRVRYRGPEHVAETAAKIRSALPAS